MSTIYTNETISTVVNAARNREQGVSLASIARGFEIPESTIRGWLKRFPNGMDNAQATQEGSEAPEPIASIPAEATDNPFAFCQAHQNHNGNTPEIAQDAPTDARTMDEAGTVDNASQSESGPVVIVGPIAIGDHQETNITPEHGWQYLYTIRDFPIACIAYANRTISHRRVTRDGVVIISPDGLTAISYDGPTQGLWAYRLDYFAFGYYIQYTGYEVAFNDFGNIVEFRYPLDGGMSNWRPFGDARNELTGQIRSYVARFLPVQTSGVSVDTTVIAPVVESDDDSDDDDDSLTCTDCDCDITKNSGIHHNGDWRCQECHYKTYDSCEHCGSIVPADDIRHVNDAFWCDECYSDNFFSCDRCDESTPNGESVTTHSGREICQHCCESDYFTCDDCGEVFHDDRLHSNDDGSYCAECFSNNSSDLIRDYGDKSANHLPKLGTPKDKLYFGVELEVCSRSRDYRDEDAREVIDSLGDDFVVLKEDGSLPSGGFEIVTCPATLDIHAKRFHSLMIDNPVRGLKSWDASNCGIHVHASRKGISALTLGKLLVFINDDRHSDLITAIAGRGANSYCGRSRKKMTDARSRRWDRYEAINLTNSATVEFRIFRGTLKYSSFMKNLEFVSASILFCKLAGCQELTIPHFREFMEAYKLTYPYLYAFLATRGYVKPSRRVETAIKGQAVGCEV